jgi:hypothetical protein
VWLQLRQLGFVARLDCSLDYTFDAFGFEAFGFDAFGFDAFGFEAFGFEAFGFEAFGFEAFGFDVLGFETLGLVSLDALGFDAFGFKAFGFDALCFEAFCFDALGFDALGFEAFGFDAFGFETLGLVSLGGQFERLVGIARRIGFVRRRFDAFADHLRIEIRRGIIGAHLHERRRLHDFAFVLGWREYRVEKIGASVRILVVHGVASVVFGGACAGGRSRPQLQSELNPTIRPAQRLRSGSDNRP